MFQRRLLLGALALALSACAQAPTQRLAPTTQPLTSVRLYTWSDRDPALVGSGLDRFIGTLRGNGLEVRQSDALPRPLASLQALEVAWDQAPAATIATHALVLTRQYEQSSQGTRYVRYEAVLWDPSTRKLVWLGTLASAASFDPMRTGQVLTTDADRRAERLAGDLLRGLDRDGLLALNGKTPHDAKGGEIPPTLLPIDIR